MIDFLKSLETNLDELNQMKITITDNEEELSYENQTIILINSVLNVSS